MSRESPQARRTRITALVAARWPLPLEPNHFVNTLLDITRSYGMNVTGSETPLTEVEILEAIDALAERHLTSSMKWGKT